MVIVPTILDSVERVARPFAHIEVQALGNLDPHIHFAILSDFRDAAAETLPVDAESCRGRARASRRSTRNMATAVRPLFPVSSNASVE